MFEKAAETYKKKNDMYSGMFQKAAQTYQAKKREDDVPQPSDDDTAANNPAVPINAYADAVAEIERQDAAAKAAAVQATMQPMGYGGLSKALRDGSMPKKKNTKVKETRREGNPKYNDDYVSGVDYPKFRPYDDVEKELADVQARRDTDFNARFPEAGELVQRSIGGKDTDADRQLRELAQQYADENAAYDARIAELKKEAKDSKNKTVLQRRERAAKQTVGTEQMRFSSPELRTIDEKIKNAEAELAAAESAQMTVEDAERALREYEDELRANGVSEQYFGEDSRYIELAQAAGNAKKSATAQKNTADANLYALRGAKTLATLPEEDRAAILSGVRAMRGNSAAGMSTSIPQTFDFSTGKYRVLTEDEFKQIRADYNAVIRKLKESGVSDADIHRMTTTLEQSADAMIAAGGNVQTAAFALQYPTLASAISVVSNLASGVTVGGAEIGRVVGNAFRGEGYKAPMNINDAAYAPVRATNDIRGTIAERIEEGNGFGGKVGSFAYQTLMSTADSVVASVLGNVGGAAAIGGSAFASAIVDAKESGVSDEQALMTGICAGIFETLFERVSIGNFNKLREVPPATLRDVALNILKSTGVNASEEGATEIANILADTIINGDYSGYAKAYQSYLAAGKSEKEAERLAKQDMIKQVGMAAFGGAVQGFFMGGIGTTWGYFGNRDANRAAGAYFTDENGRINAENRNALIGEGLASGNEEIRAYARTLEGKRTMSQAEAGQLYRMLVAETQGNYTEEKAKSDETSSPAFSEQALVQNKQLVSEMQPVSRITGNEFQKGEVDLITQVANFFKSLGNKAFNEEIGSVTVDRRGAKTDIAHGIGRKKAASFQAVFDVINNGKVVDYQTNWKGRGYDTAVVAAPITIGTTPYYMGVVLTRSQGENRFYVHEVFATDEKGTSPFKTGTTASSRTPGEDAPSVISILNSIREVKNNINNVATAADSQVFPDFSDRSPDEPISEAEFRAAYAARVAREAAAERAKTQADTDLGNMLSGELTNGRADEIAKSQSLANAFEALTGEKLTGTLAEKRKQLKAMQTFAAEKLRDVRADARMAALKTADTREKMRAALGTAGQAVYDAGYDAGVAEYKLRGFAGDALLSPSELYNANFGAYYRQGYQGDAFDFMGNAAIGEADARRIFEAGRRDAKADTYLNAAERSAFEHGVSAEEGATAKRLSQVLGREILFIDADEDFHGCTIDGVIYLGAKSDRSVLATVAHEYTHLLEGKGLYKKLRDFVFDTLAGEGATAEDLRAAKRAEHVLYAGLDDAQIDREIVAEFVETRLLTDEQVMRAVVRREGKSFAHRLLDTLRGLIEKVKAALHIGNADAEQLKMLERGRDILAEVIRSEETSEAADGIAFAFVGKNKNGIRKYETDFHADMPQAERGRLFKERLATIFNLGAVELKTDVKKIKVQADRITYKKNIYGDVGGIDSISAKVNALYDLVDILETSVFKSATMEPSFANENVAAKNLAHKGVKYWYKFENHIILDGVPYKVVFNIRDKGKEQYQYLIEFDKETAQNSNKKRTSANDTAADGQLRAFMQKSSDTTVSQNNSGVNSKYTQNSKKDADIDGFSVGGVNAKTADVGRLADAERMEQGGADSETVRRETGWYRGYDGKWRFEIDDSKMHFINHREESRRTWKLDELIRHDALFAAYPELRDYTVLNFGISDDVEAAFYPGLNRITLDPRLSRAEKRAALIHEIQHAIQLIEGFTAGATTDYWRGSLKTAEEKQLELRLRDFDAPDIFFEADMRKLLEGTPAAERDAAQTALEKHYGEAHVREYVDLYNRLRDLRAEREQDAERAYRNTAGEIEASDVANRLGLSERQRAETRPDIDREEVRFSQSAGWNHAEYDPETAGIKEQLEHSAETLNAMRTITSVEVPQSFTSKSEAAKWAIETLKRTGYQVERQGYGVIHFNENDIKYGAKYADTAAEKAAFAAIPAVLKRGIEIGGHANHKAREKQTVTFAAPVELNGIRGNMAVVVNKRGDHYYTHRIVLPDGRTFTFSEKNNATRELSRGVTVSGSLAETTSVASKNSISNSAENVNTILKNDADIRFSVGDGQTDADAEVSDADKRFAPVESAIKLLQGGADLWRTQRETGAQPNQIALRMATSGESDAEIRRLTGLYRDALGVWTYDSAWLDAHVPDIADTRELRAGYKLGTVDEQLLGLAPEEVKASRRRLLDSAKLPADADAARVRQTAANLHRGLRPTAAEFAEDRKTAAAKEAARLITAEKVPSADAAIRTGALLADIADVLEKKKVRAETITRLTAQVRGENGAWETDNAAMTKIIRAGSKQLDVQDFTDFLFENAKELTESSYNSQYGHKETYALDKLGVQIENPIVDIAKYGTKPSELIANEREQEELKRYIENEYASAAHPSPAERADARDVATGIRTLGQISQDSRREVVLDLVYANLARRGLRDNGIETFYMVQKQRYAEELAQNIFKTSIEPGKKAVQQWRLTANTALRNNRMVFGEEIGRYLNETIFEKVVENEAERQRFMQREIDKIRKLELTKLESQAVQMLAEDTKESRLAFYELLKGKGKKLDVEKCRAAVTVFRACYNLYYDAINEFLVMHGYKPIGFQKNYMPRLQKEADVSALRERLNALGIETEEVTELPAEIAGRTETFKPGKKYNPFFEHRTSKENKNVQYDALGGFDSYITYLSEVLYHTDDIQKLRTLAGALRERYASGAVSKNIAELKEQLYSPDPDKSFADIEAKLTAAYDEVKLNNYFGTYATWLDDYTNNIAGKQARADREMEALFGRRVLNLGKKLNNIYVSAVISGNISSALKQGVQIPFATIECGRLNMVRALIDMLPGNNRLNKAAEFDKKSVFLAGKRGVDYASELALREKGRALGGYFFEKTDIFVTRLILRAKFFEVIHSNPSISFDEAVREADRYISAMVGNRMKGSKPVLFNAKNVIYRTATAFQLENLNIVEYAIHDIPEKYRQYGKIHGVFRMRVKILRDLLSALVEVFLWNRLFQMILGQTPIPGDMIGILADSLGAGWNLAGNEYLLSLIDDLLDAIAGKRTLGTENRRANGKFNGWEALNQAKSDILDDIPIASNVFSMLGWSDGKLALPKLGTPGKVLDDAKNGDFNAKKIKGYLFQDAAQWFPGGTQLNKSKRGIELIADKGMYSSSGKLMFASDMNLWDCIRAVLFGPTANEEYRESFFGGRYLSAEETALWQQMREAGGKPKESFDALQDVYNAGKTVKDSYAEKLRIAEDAVSEDLPKEQKREKEQEYSELREEASAASKAAKVEKIDNLPLNGRLKALILYGDVASENEKAVMDALEVTLQVDHMKVYRFMSGFVLQEKVADKREYLKHDLILTDAEKATVYYHYFANDDAQDFIDELRRRGGKDADIYKVLAASYGREEEKITSADRATAITDSSLPASAKEEAMYELISDELHDKYTAVQDAGGSVDEFLAAYAATRGITSDKDRAGNTVALSKARKMKKAIDAAAPDAPKKVRRALYSAFGVSKSVWY